MATTDTSTNPQVLEAFWKKQFLKEYESNLVFKQLGLMGDVPEHSGMVVSWFQLSNLATGAVVGESADPASTSLTTSLQSATLQVVSQNIAITEAQIRQATDNFMPEVMKRVGRAAAATEDKQIRDSIFTAGGMVEYGGTAAFRNSIADDASFDLNISSLRKAVYKLESANAMPHEMASDGAKYVGIIGPAGHFDIMGDSNWQSIAVNTDKMVDRVAQNKVGTTYGVTWFYTSDALTVSNSGSASTDVIQTYILGGEYFGIASAIDPTIVSKIPSPVSAAGLYGTVAYKYLTAYKQLHASGMVRLETSTSVESRA